jgi:hypothetical protein
MFSLLVLLKSKGYLLRLLSLSSFVLNKEDHVLTTRINDITRLTCYLEPNKFDFAYALTPNDSTLLIWGAKQYILE